MTPIDKIRAEMKKQKLDGFFVPRADEFQGEYVPASASRLEFATGFTGSAGAAVILTDKAAFFTDGRYDIQAHVEVDKNDFAVNIVEEAKKNSPTEWIEQNLPKGARFGIDPWLHTINDVKKIKEAVEKAGGTLVYVDSNPLDAAWDNRPAAPVTPAFPQPLKFSGKESKEKRQDLARALNDKNTNALAMTMPEDICWLLNIRGSDVPCNPFCLSYAIAHDDGSVDWFVDAAKLTDEVKNWIGPDVRIYPFENFSDEIKRLAAADKEIQIDPVTAPAALKDIAGVDAIVQRSPIPLMKAKKNKTEIEGSIRAHIRDGVAMVKFLSQLSEQGAAAKFDEISASDLLEKIRSEGEHFKGLSFDTISGAGGNGAIVHYRSTPETNKPLTAGPVYLLDSGAQYQDGTTDITRTLGLDTTTPEMRENFTRVLRGHIAVATAVFPEGTTGDKIDALARKPLQEVGLDYAHGTGHGVGSYLSVHEGPAGISTKSTSVPLEPGMILSNEPGYYKAGEYGIRLENLVTVIDTGQKDANGKKLLAFQTLTLAPFDRGMIEPHMLTDAELKWLNDYHARVRAEILPLLDKSDVLAVKYLTEATEPIRKPPPAAKPMKLHGFFF